MLFALLALLLEIVGVYGVVSYSVGGPDTGDRLADRLGAMRSDIMRWVFTSGMRPVAAGLVLGLAGAVAIATALRSILFGISPADPLSTGAVALALLFASGTAATPA